MACAFTIDFQTSASELVALMKNKVENQGGTFNSNYSGGNFDISLLGAHITGSYTITGQQMGIDIIDKPFFISCDQIKKYVENNLVT